MTDLRRIPARRGIATLVARGQVATIINTHGTQVVDCWAFSAADTNEFMSMEHSRVSMGRLTPRIGDTLVTNRRRGILVLCADTTPGAHDTLVAACDRYRYELLGHPGYHDNCTDNLARAIAELGFVLPETPCPLNLFQNSPARADGSLAFLPPLSAPGQSVSLRAEMELVLVFSACPQDLLPINGTSCKPTEAHFTVGDTVPQ